MARADAAAPRAVQRPTVGTPHSCARSRALTPSARRSCAAAVQLGHGCAKRAARGSCGSAPLVQRGGARTAARRGASGGASCVHRGRCAAGARRLCHAQGRRLCAGRRRVPRRRHEPVRASADPHARVRVGAANEAARGAANEPTAGWLPTVFALVACCACRAPEARPRAAQLGSDDRATARRPRRSFLRSSLTPPLLHVCAADITCSLLRRSAETKLQWRRGCWCGAGESDAGAARARAGVIVPAPAHQRAGASAAFPGARPHLRTQDNAQALGLNVVRTWAFCDGSRPGALQPRPWQRDERVFQALDSVIAQAQTRNLRLLLTLTNNWQDYGALPAPCARARSVSSLARCCNDTPRQRSSAHACAGGIAEYVSWAQQSGERVGQKEGARGLREHAVGGDAPMPR
jgi:hypothetical protein